MNTTFFKSEIQAAKDVLDTGGVIAYPTEYCFGLGCDPRNEAALEKLLAIKQRTKDQGVILIAANLPQIELYADMSSLKRKVMIQDSWPGPNTWLLPVEDTVSKWLRGKHSTLAMRIPDHAFCRALCTEFGHPLVSTSANRHGENALTTAQAVEAELGDDLDYVVKLQVGGAPRASTIRDALTGETLR